MMTSSLQAVVDSAQQAARAAGGILREMQHQVNPREKGPRDLVSEADLASEDLIRDRLTKEFPDFLFIGEEQQAGISEPQPIRHDRYYWVVDPLDGTTNYVHGMDNYAVSIGLRHQNQIHVGVIYDPTRNQMFHAIRDGGAFCNDRRLNVSRVGLLGEALVATSFPAHVKPKSPDIERFVSVLCQSQALRRLGSAALNLCYVAAGQLDAYWATSVKLWDIAAGWLLVSEAGGTVTHFDGSPASLDDPRFVSSSTTQLHNELLAVLNSTESVT